MKYQKFLTFHLLAIYLWVNSSAVFAQNVGIGVANPQKGKVEIAGALGGHTTVLTIGSDGTGISLQRNWPTIGLNQYRDTSNVQRYIGAGHAGSVFLSPVDGSIVFTQFGQGAANGLIANATYPLVITGTGVVNIWKQINLDNNAKLTSTINGVASNMLPLAFGSVRSDGVKTGGTNNFTTRFAPADNNAFYIQFTHSVVATIIVVTPSALGPRYSSAVFHDDFTYEVRIWDKNGLAVKDGFGFVIYNL
jgi:hypothetical protein